MEGKGAFLEKTFMAKRYYDKTPTLEPQPRLPEEEDRTPVGKPWSFYPTGYPRTSPGFGLPTAKDNKIVKRKKRWWWKP